MEWSKKIGIDYLCLWHRITKLHWSFAKAINTPVRKKAKP
jgi:hypothetical protein